MSEEPMIGKPASYEKMPVGIGFNPKTSELTNMKFICIENVGKEASSEKLLFRRSGDAGGIADLSDRWDDVRQFDVDFGELEELSELFHWDEEKVRASAEKHGPLFGSTFIETGLAREPADMWYTAAMLMRLGIRLKAAADSGNWRMLQQDGWVVFDAEIDRAGLSGRQVRDIERHSRFVLRDGQPAMFTAKVQFASLPEDYERLVLDEGDLEAGIWRSRRLDAPGLTVEKQLTGRPLPQLGMFDETSKESSPDLTVAVVSNWRSPTEVMPVGEEPIRIPLESVGASFADEMGVRLCKVMEEALVSLHCRHVDFEWIGGEFRPVFRERLRYLWYLYSIHMGKEDEVLDFCEHCGIPFVKTRADRKYCGERCRRAANR